MSAVGAAIGAAVVLAATGVCAALPYATRPRPEQPPPDDDGADGNP